MLVYVFYTLHDDVWTITLLELKHNFLSFFNHHLNAKTISPGPGIKPVLRYIYLHVDIRSAVLVAQKVFDIYLHIVSSQKIKHYIKSPLLSKYLKVMRPIHC